ncbi:hypothetical protein AOQ84DRAFT_285759 [Glonium stellatum]|uniref:DUF7580 domain-containing protein n=1 Tax=Glonium stellatum TaxID=574774 RepID=A0A8E2JWG4_9PEZI|nr:hypothetical protein AOQ84DRAFT_285759 [Glonium stellatum]
MAGVEAAGFILAAIPLVISALEHYETGLGKVKAFWKWEDELSDAIRKLWYHYTSYELTIRVLLTTIATTTQLEEMVANPNSELWKNSEMEEKFQVRLGSAYKAYTYTMTEIEDAMDEISRRLDIDRAVNATRNDLEAIVIANPRIPSEGAGLGHYRFKKRVKFSMKKQKVKQLLGQLEHCIARLDGFTDKAEKLEPYHNNRKSKFTVPIHLIQQHAKNLHQVLSQAWTCSSHPSHHTNLLLGQRIVKSKAKSSIHSKTECELADEVTRFTLSMSNNSLPSQWKYAEVQVFEQTETPSKTQSKVKIISPPSSSNSSVYDNMRMLKYVTNMCSALQQFAPLNSRPGFFLDPQGKLRGIYPASKRLFAEGNNFVTLDELLRGVSSEAGKKEKLTKEEFYILAVTLSSSLLQLHTTPWLGSRWSKKDIVFLQNGNPSTHNVDIRHPYITQVYFSQSISEVPPGNATISDSGDDSSRLLALAVMLLEIYFNQPIELQRSEKDCASSQRSNELDDLGIVKRWIGQEKGNLSWAFQNAVSHCMKCFVDPSANLNNADFRQGVIDQVLLPLQDELLLWTEGPLRG